MIEEGLIFDLLYIDEAHELLNFNFGNISSNRSLLLARLIKISKVKNSNLKIIYLSPTIQDVDNLVLVGENSIESNKIKNNLKILDIKYVDKKNREFIYDLFLDSFIPTNKKIKSHMQYISTISQSFKKNLHFLYRPVMIENYSEELFMVLPSLEIPEEIRSLQKELEQIIHPKFKLIKYLSKGIVYMHGRLPLIIRNYLLKYVRESEFLQNFVANSVVLAGMNLPIDNLVYISGFKSPSDLNNLIGRVNRLNEIFKKESPLSKILIPIHFIDMEKYPQYKKGKLKGKIESLRGRSKDIVKNPLLEHFSDKQKKKTADDIRAVENKIIENYSNPDFFTRLNKAGAQQILNYTNSGITKLEKIIANASKVPDEGDIYQNILNKMKSIFFDEFVSDDKEIIEYFFYSFK